MYIATSIVQVAVSLPMATPSICLDDRFAGYQEHFQ